MKFPVHGLSSASGASFARRALVGSAGMLLYALAIGPLYRAWGPMAVLAAVLPVGLAGWLLGVWGGCAASIVNAIIGLFLLHPFDGSGWLALFRHEQAEGWILAAVVGVALGRVRDLSDRWQEELHARLQADERIAALEQEVERGRRRHSDDASVMSLHRTAPLAPERSLRRQALLFEALLDGVLVLDAEGRVTDCNVAAERTFRSAKHDLLGRVAPIFHASPQDDLRETILAELTRERRWSGTLPCSRAEGGDGTIEVVLVMQQEEDAAGTIIAICRDITEQVAAAAALAQSQAQLIESQKMEAIGRLSGAVAHDFNNMLTAIKGFATLLQMEIEEGDSRHAYLEEIQKAADHSASLTRQLLAFSRKQVLQPKVLEVNAVVSRVGGMLQRLIGENVALQTLLDPTAARVFADPGQLEQVLINLAVNARDAMPDGGALTIRTSNAILHEEHTRRLGFAAPGAYVLISVDDTGCGIPKEVQERIFEPFFTTKAQGKGTGLGLSTVYGIVKQSGGQLVVESAVGVGTSFRIYLPRKDDPAQQEQTTQVRQQGPSGSETILLVEDEPAVRRLAFQILRRSGYRILEASDGAEAITLFDQHTGPIDLLVTDVVMPHVSGKSLAEQILARQAEIRVLFMSGYTDDAIEHYGVLAPGTFFIEKPFTPDGLARKVRDVLDAPRSPQASAEIHMWH